MYFVIPLLCIFNGFLFVKIIFQLFLFLRLYLGKVVYMLKVALVLDLLFRRDSPREWGVRGGKDGI